MNEDHMAARYTAEYMANEYRNEASAWKYKYEKLAEQITNFLSALPRDRIIWYPDIEELAMKLLKQMEKDHGR